MRFQWRLDSATAEDLVDASFAGHQETFLNIRGLDNLLAAVKQVFASLHDDRAISYRFHKDFAHSDVALSAGIKRMIRSDIGASGVMFTLEMESGFDQVVFITASYGLGEAIVQGAVNLDEFYINKPALAQPIFVTPNHTFIFYQQVILNGQYPLALQILILVRKDYFTHSSKTMR